MGPRFQSMKVLAPCKNAVRRRTESAQFLLDLLVPEAETGCGLPDCGPQVAPANAVSALNDLQAHLSGRRLTGEGDQMADTQEPVATPPTASDAAPAPDGSLAQPPERRGTSQTGVSVGGLILAGIGGLLVIAAIAL